MQLALYTYICIYKYIHIIYMYICTNWTCARFPAAAVAAAEVAKVWRWKSDRSLLTQSFLTLCYIRFRISHCKPPTKWHALNRAFFSRISNPWKKVHGRHKKSNFSSFHYVWQVTIVCDSWYHRYCSLRDDRILFDIL